MDSQHYKLKSPWTYTCFPSPLSRASHSRRHRLLRSSGLYQRGLVDPDQLGRERPEVHQQLRDCEVAFFYDHRPQSWCDGKLPRGGLVEARIRLDRTPLRSPSPALGSAEPPEPTHTHHNSFRPPVSIPYLNFLFFPSRILYGVSGRSGGGGKGTERGGRGIYLRLLLLRTADYARLELCLRRLGLLFGGICPHRLPRQIFAASGAPAGTPRTSAPSASPAGRAGNGPGAWGRASCEPGEPILHLPDRGGRHLLSAGGRIRAPHDAGLQGLW